MQLLRSRYPVVEKTATGVEACGDDVTTPHSRRSHADKALMECLGDRELLLVLDKCEPLEVARSLALELIDARLR